MPKPTQGSSVTSQKLKEYVSYFSDLRPEVFEYFSDGEKPVFDFSSQSEEAEKLLLLYSVLNQDISHKKLTQIIVSLYHKFKEKIFDLTSFDYEILENEIAGMVVGINWQLSSRAAGILRSTCDFFKLHKDYHEWILEAPTTESLVQEISTQIFYMGKNSTPKYKARTYIYLLLLAKPSLLQKKWQASGLLPLTRGARNLWRFVERVNKGKRSRQSEKEPQEELEEYNRFILELYPKESWKVHLPFSYFKINSGPGVYLCEQKREGCHNCILQKHCRP